MRGTEKRKAVSTPTIIVVLVIIVAVGMGAYILTRPKEPTPIPPKPSRMPPAPAKAKFKVSNLSINPSEIKPGETISISLDVGNVGDLSGNYTVRLKVDGSVKDSQTVTLTGGESTNVLFQIKENKLGEHDVDVAGLFGTFTVSLIKVIGPRAPLTKIKWTAEKVGLQPKPALEAIIYFKKSKLSGVKVELYEVSDTKLNLIGERWLVLGGEFIWPEFSVGSSSETLPTKKHVLIVKDPKKRIIYENIKEFKAGNVEIIDFDISWWHWDQHTYEIIIRVKTSGDFPVYIHDYEVYIDGQKVPPNYEYALLPRVVLTGYAKKIDRFLFKLKSALKEGPHSIRLVLKDEKGNIINGFEKMIVLERSIKP